MDKLNLANQLWFHPGVNVPRVSKVPENPRGDYSGVSPEKKRQRK